MLLHQSKSSTDVVPSSQRRSTTVFKEEILLYDSFKSGYQHLKNVTVTNVNDILTCFSVRVGYNERFQGVSQGLA